MARVSVSSGRHCEAVRRVDLGRAHPAEPYVYQVALEIHGQNDPLCVVVVASTLEEFCFLGGKRKVWENCVILCTCSGVWRDVYVCVVGVEVRH